MSSNSSTDPLYQGETFTTRFTFTDTHSNLYNPSTLAADIIDPEGNVKVSFTLANMINVSTGVYMYTANVPADGKPGIWKIKGIATYAPSNLSAPFIIPFIVSEFK